MCLGRSQRMHAKGFCIVGSPSYPMTKCKPPCTAMSMPWLVGRLIKYSLTRSVEGRMQMLEQMGCVWGQCNVRSKARFITVGA